MGRRGSFFLLRKFVRSWGLSPIPSLEDVLEEKPIVEITLEEFHEFRKELSRKAEL